MALGNPRRISGKRRLLVAKLVGVSGQFQRTKHAGSAEFNLQTSIETNGTKRTKGASHFVLSFFSSAYALPLTPYAAFSASMQFVMSSVAKARYAGRAAVGSLWSSVSRGTVIAKASSVASVKFVCEAVGKAAFKQQTIAALSFGMVSAGTIAYKPTDEPTLLQWVDAANPANTLMQPTASVAPSAVNVATNRITMAMSGTASGFVRTTESYATPVKYTTTGTPIGGMTPGEYYLPEDMGDGTYRFFPLLASTDWAKLPGYEANETIYPYMAYSFQAGVIDITSQGTGTHTFTTDPLMQVWKDKSPQNVNFQENLSNLAFRLLTDGSGRKYVELPGATGFKNNDTGIGKVTRDNIDNTVFGGKITGKRYLVGVIVGKIRNNIHVQKRRILFKPADVTIATGIIAATTHGFTTAKRVYMHVMSDGGAFPTPTIAFGSEVYIRSVNANSVSLHPTAQDATDNTNKYVFSSAGTGQLSLTDPTEVQTEVLNRQAVFDLCANPNGHDFTPCALQYRAVLPCTSSYFLTGTSFNGLLNSTMTATQLGRTWNTKKVFVFVPSGCVSPICTDTSTRLTSGFYWATYAPSTTSTVRLSRTEAQANLCVGKTNAQLTNNEFIRYDLTGCVGSLMLHTVDEFFPRQFDDLWDATKGIAFIPMGTDAAYVFITDFANNAAPVFWSGVNSLDNVINGGVSTSSSTTTGTASSGILLGNAAEPHIPGFADIRHIVINAVADGEDVMAIAGRELAWAMTQ